MPVVLGEPERDAERFRFTLTDDVVVVETAQKLDQYLEGHMSEDLVVIGPDVPMNVATAVAEGYRLQGPFLGVVLLRRRIEVSTMNEALRAGVREVVPADDVDEAGLQARLAARASVEVYPYLFDPGSGGVLAHRALSTLETRETEAAGAGQWLQCLEDFSGLAA